jgi:hypothetical protein
MNDYIECSILVAALVDDEDSAKDLIRQMNGVERKNLAKAILRLDWWIDEVSEEESQEK